MLIDFISRKSRKNKEEAINYDALPSVEDPESENLDSSLEENDDDLHGVEFKEYAKRRGLHTSEVWRLIRDGQLIARTENGFVYVYGIDKKSSSISTKTIGDIAKENTLIDEAISSKNLPPLPTNDDDRTLPATIDYDRSSEIDYLIECLQNLQSENQEILKISKESVSQITSISKQAIQAKDEVITHKDSLLEAKENILKSKAEELEQLQAKLRKQEQDLNKLKQDNEDLEMLNQTLSTNL